MEDIPNRVHDAIYADDLVLWTREESIAVVHLKDARCNLKARKIDQVLTALYK
jgi:hypothetical protein